MRTPEEQAQARELRQECADQANTLLLLNSLTHPPAAAAMVRHGGLVRMAVHAGIAGTILTLQRRGLLPKAGEQA